MPDGRGVVSPVRRPREFARALGAMVAEQAGPRGRIVVLRNAVEGRTFSTAHKSQTVYHGPVAYLDDPYKCLESASSELELGVSPALVEAMRKPRPQPEGSGFVRPGAAEYFGGRGAGGRRLVAGAGRDAAGLRRRRQPGGGAAAQGCRDAAGDLGETATLRAAVEALREAVGAADAGYGKDATAAAWHAEPLLRFLPRRWVAGSPTCG